VSPAVGADKPNPPAAVEEAAVDRRQVVQLDVQLAELDLERLAEVFHMFRIVNGRPHRQSVHAYMRASRTCMDAFIGRMSNPSTLEIQGRIRGTGVLTRDVCRKVFTPEDDEDCCPEDCRHQEKLASGDYTQVVGIDVPLDAAGAAAILAQRGVKHIMLALHVHVARDSVIEQQAATWVGPLGSDTFAMTGSLGKFIINTPGRAAWQEIDHAYLTMQMPVNGVKPELYCELGSYKVYRLTRTVVAPTTPMVVASLRQLNSKYSASVFAAVSAPGRNPVYMLRITDELVAFRDNLGWYATTGETIREANSILGGRAIDESLRRKVVTSILRKVGNEDAGRVVGTLLDLEAHAQTTQQDAWDSGTMGTWLTWLPFAWLFNTRRSFAATLTRRIRGEAPQRVWRLVLGVVMLFVSFLPWPSYHCVEVGGDNTDPGHSHGHTGTHGSTVCRLEIVAGTNFYLRAILLVITTLNLASLAYGADPAYEFRAAYEDDRFAPIYCTEGSLPFGFGLPGYVASCDVSKPLADGASIRTRDPAKWVDIDNPRDMLFAVGVVFCGYTPSVTLPCQQNLVCALRDRQLAVTPEPDHVFFREQAREYLAQFRDPGDVAEEDFEAWNCRFDPVRRNKHDRARQAWLDCVVSDYAALIRKGFTKAEKVLRVDKEIGKAPFPPRLITGATDEFNVVWAVYFFQARENIKKAYADLPNNVLLASGSTSRELGDWFTEALATSGRAICGDDQYVIVDGLILELDGSKHDSHMNSEFFEFKWTLYHLLCHEIPRRVIRLAREGARITLGVNYALAVWWTHTYRTRSGDPDTEKGNSVQTDIVAWSSQNIVREMNRAGASHTVIMDAVVKNALRFGYVVSGKLSSDPTSTSFLSGSFMPVDGQMYWYPNVGRQLVKLGWSLRSCGPERTWREYAGVLNSYRDFSFVPFLRTYVDVISQLVPEQYRLAPPTKRWLIGPGKTPQSPSDDTWDWFSRRYSLTKSDEEEFKRTLESITSLPFVVRSEYVEHMLRVDMA